MIEPQIGITEVFSEALNGALKHSPPHVAFESAVFTTRSYLASQDVVDLSSKGSGPTYKLAPKRVGEKRK
jgi:hypothetical protein